MRERRPGLSLWRLDAAHARELKAAAALHATAQVLRARRPLHGGEQDFLRLHRFVSALPARSYTAVVADPAAYWYAHLAFDLTGAVLGTLPLSAHARDYTHALGAPDPTAALGEHLRRFALFALAGALHAGRPLRLPGAYALGLPAALPATDLCLEGEGAAALTGVSAAGDLLLKGGARLPFRAGAQAHGLRVTACPVAKAGKLRVALNPLALDLPGTGLGAQAGTFGLAAHTAMRPTLERALALAVRHLPGFAGLARDYLRVLAVKPLASGGFTNLTHSELPGACLLGWVDQPWELADTLIHELHHNRLFALDEFGPWFADEDGALGAGGWYSPWRDDLRPLAGLLHAVYVHVPVWRYWLGVWQAADAPPEVRELAADRLRRYPAQLRMGLAQLRRHARFTPAGRTLYQGLGRRVAGLERKATQAGVPPDPLAREVTPAGIVPVSDAAGAQHSVRAVLRAHLRASAPPDQAAALASLLG